MQHYYISRSWMVSTTAQWIYRRAAWLSIGLFVLLVVMPFVDSVPEILVPLYRLVFYACALGAALTLVAMEYFLFSFDPSSAGKKSVWFLVLCLIPVGPAIYCLVGYSRSSILDKPQSQRAGMVEEFRGSR